jgi:hypothetical protein
MPFLIIIIIREMLTSVLRALDKKLKVVILSWKLCIQLIEIVKSNFFYMKFHNYFLFNSLTIDLRTLVSKTLIIITNEL